jgi:hypothetical protein
MPETMVKVDGLSSIEPVQVSLSLSFVMVQGQDCYNCPHVKTTLMPDLDR